MGPLGAAQVIDYVDLNTNFVEAGHTVLSVSPPNVVNEAIPPVRFFTDVDDTTGATNLNTYLHTAGNLRVSSQY